MKSIFGIDSPLMRWLDTFANLLFLNVMTVLLCIPVITAGAAFTALHAVCLKIVRKEEGYIASEFFKAFKNNFKQATGMWLMFLAGIAVIVLDVVVLYYAEVNFPFYVRGAVLVVAFFILATALFAFPMQAKFENSVIMTVKNAFKACMIQFPKTFLMMVVLVGEILAIVKLPGFIGAFVIMFFFSFHAYISALLYNKFFLLLEERGNGGQNDEENVS